MKKFYLLLGVTVLMSLAAAAQNGQIGIKGGLNVSNLHYDNDTDADSKVGAHVGLLFHFPMGGPVALQPEVVFSMQGAEFGNDELQANYLNVPFMIQYKLPGGFRLQTGPQVGVLLSAEYEDEDGIDHDWDNVMKKTDLAWSLGFAFQSSSGLGIDARYNIGLTEVFKGRPNDVTNRVLQFGLFYVIR